MKLGYQSDFIGSGIHIPIPKFTPKLEGAVLRNDKLREGIFLDYRNYTLVMNSATKQIILAASNINQNKHISINRELSKDWETDSRINDEQQLDNRYYKSNDWDRGHMVQRNNNNWADSFQDAIKANNDTFYYTNAAFQHKFFNQDEWLKLEDFIGNWKEDSNGKLCVFTGTVHLSFDRMYSRSWHDSVRIPSGFFKIVCYRSKATNKLKVRAFLLYQDAEFIGNKKQGSSIIKLKNYQVTIAEIEELTGLEFDPEIARNNPLYYSGTNVSEDMVINNYPERIPIESKEDIVTSITSPRKTQEAKDSNKTLIIAAAMVNPIGKDEIKNEWISLLNISREEIDLTGWRLEDHKRRIIKLEEVIKKVLPGDSIRVEMGKFKTIRLPNTGGTIILYNDKNEVVDREYYTKEEVKTENKALRF